MKSITRSLSRIRKCKDSSLSILLGCLFFFAFTSCEEPTEPVEPPPIPGEYVVPDITPTGDEKFLNEGSGYIFDQDKLHTFELTLPASSLARINADPTAEQYVEGSLTFEGETISPVGIRYKGSVGAFVGCVSGNDWANPSGRKTCTKLSMKVKINWEGSETQFFKLKKLQFHSQNLDDSKMRERLAYWLFREMGVPAPRSVHARLMINGKYSGIYALTEQIDGRFTRKNFEDGTGNLYKEIWPLRDNGTPHSEQDYIAALETNEDENPSAQLMRSFAEEIANSNHRTRRNVVGKWMDVNEIISYAVIDRMIKVDDGAFHWYCGSGGCDPHNFYWYEDPTEEKMHLIPWDMDNTFENILFNANPVTPIADDWGETTANCQPFSYGNFGLRQKSAACDKLVATWVTYEDEYAALTNQFKAGPFSEAETDARLQAWAAQIRAAVQEAVDTHDDATTIGEWETAIQNLKTGLSFARSR